MLLEVVDHFFLRDARFFGSAKYIGSASNITGFEAFRIRCIDDTGDVQHGVSAFAQFSEAFRIIQCAIDPYHTRPVSLITAC